DEVVLVLLQPPAQPGGGFGPSNTRFVCRRGRSKRGLCSSGVITSECVSANSFPRSVYGAGIMIADFSHLSERFGPWPLRWLLFSCQRKRLPSRRRANLFQTSRGSRTVIPRQNSK